MNIGVDRDFESLVPHPIGRFFFFWHFPLKHIPGSSIYIPFFVASPTHNAIIYYFVTILKRFHLPATRLPLNHGAGLRPKGILFISAGRAIPLSGGQLYSLPAVHDGAGRSSAGKMSLFIETSCQRKS